MKYQSQEVEILSKRTIFGKTVAERTISDFDKQVMKITRENRQDKEDPKKSY